VRVRGTVNGRRYERAITVTLPANHAEDGDAIASLWARAAVHDRMSRMALRDDPALIREVTALGLAHHIVTPWTSFVAVEEVAHANSEEAAPEARATVSPARALPGDPEVRVPAPADARAVTLVLPFGESVHARYERELGVWSGRFLIPRDAQEGTYPIEVLITHADGRLEHLRLWYTVDQSAPQVVVDVHGPVRAGEWTELEARQTVTRADLAQMGMGRASDAGVRSTPQAEIWSDARRVEVRTPDGQVIALRLTESGSWAGRWRVPPGTEGQTLRFDVVVVDLAANVSHQALALEVSR
jgi:Ca-activated chloride channel family protein